jgi:hypothetical protein
LLRARVSYPGIFLSRIDPKEPRELFGEAAHDAAPARVGGWGLFDGLNVALSMNGSSRVNRNKMGTGSGRVGAVFRSLTDRFFV